MDVVLTGLGVYTPSDKITNAELVDSFNAHIAHHGLDNDPSCAAFIAKASGIQQRYVIDKSGILDPTRLHPRIRERNDEEPSLQAEMSVEAAQTALAQAGRQGSDIDLVITACSNFTRPYPAISIEIQQLLGAKGFAFDMNVACASALFALQTAVSLVRNNQAKCALVVNPEICTAHLDFTARESHFIFGDACSGFIVEREDTALAPLFTIRSTRTETVFSNNIRNNTGFLDHTYDSYPTKRFFRQNGPKVFKEVIGLVDTHLHQHLESMQITTTDLQRLWLHQANANMNRLIAEKILGKTFLPEQAPIILDRYANTSSAGSVIALAQHHQDLQPGALGLWCAFGAGYSVGSAILERC